jgi:hypothetical protein
LKKSIKHTSLCGNIVGGGGEGGGGVLPETVNTAVNIILVESEKVTIEIIV